MRFFTNCGAREMERIVYAVVLTVMTVASAYAASDISAKFDGIYVGEASPVVAMGAPGCPSFAIEEVAIAKGFLKSPKTESSPAITGFITEEGYLAAHMTRAGHQRSALDGRFEDGVIGAGFIEPDSGCVWVVHLRRKPGAGE